MEEKIELKRLTLDIPKDFHDRIKSQCAFMNITIRKYVMRAVLEKIIKDEQYLS